MTSAAAPGGTVSAAPGPEKIEAHVWIAERPVEVERGFAACEAVEPLGIQRAGAPNASAIFKFPFAKAFLCAWARGLQARSEKQVWRRRAHSEADRSRPIRSARGPEGAHFFA